MGGVQVPSPDSATSTFPASQLSAKRRRGRRVKGRRLHAWRATGSPVGAPQLGSHLNEWRSSRLQDNLLTL